jgi:hypothetical protein
MSSLIPIDLRTNAKEVQRALGASRQAMGRIISQAINEAARSVHGKVLKAAAAETGIKRKLLKPRVLLYRATADFPQARIFAGTVGFPVSALGKKPSVSRGTVRAGRFRTAAPGAFMATFKSGKRTAVQRGAGAARSSGKDSENRPRRGRLPVYEVTISVGKQVEALLAMAARVLVPPAVDKAFARIVAYKLKQRARGR